MSYAFRRAIQIAIAVLLGALTPGLSTAQQTTSISGSVSDQTGGPIAGAQVNLFSGSAEHGRSTKTDAVGRYRFDGLQPGEYVVLVAVEGFQKVEQKISVQPNAPAIADVRLALQSITQDVQVVAVAGYARSARDLPVSATVVTREQALASPERSVDGLLRHVASVQLQGDDADAVHPLVPSIAMRGIGVGDTADRAVVLVDGLPINSGFFGNVSWNRVPKRTVERVEAVRGASSSLFGSFAMGGVVDVITHVPDKRETTAELQYGEYNRVQANLNHGDVIGDAAFNVNANLTDTDGYLLVLDQNRRPIDEPLGGRLANVQGRLDLSLSPTVHAFVRAGFNDQRRTGGYHLQQSNNNVSDVAGGIDADLQSRGTLGLRAMFAHEHFDVRNVRIVDDATTFVANPHVAESNDVGLSAQWSKSLGGVISHLTAGVDGRRIDGSDEQQVFNTPGQLSATIVGGGVQTSIGAFGQVTLRPSSRSEVLAGVRVDRFSNTDGRIVTSGRPSEYADRSFSIASPRVAARYQVTPAVGVRGALFGGFRAPTLAELYRSFESPTFRGLSNPDLKDEHLRGGDAGVEITRGRVTAQVNGFYNRLEDFVGSAEVGDVAGKFTVMASNVAAVRSRGVEAIGAVQLSRRLVVHGNYTFTSAEVVEGELAGNAAEGAPRHAMSIAGSYLAPTSTVTMKARYVGDSFQDISNEAPQEARFIVDVLVSRRVRRHLDVFLVGENVFDDRYVSDGFGGTLGAPRQMSAGVRLMF